MVPKIYCKAGKFSLSLRKSFSGGSVEGNLPVTAGDTGSIPASGMPHASEQRGHSCRAQGLQLLKPVLPRA